MKRGDRSVFTYRGKAATKGEILELQESTSGGINADSRQSNVIKRMDVKRRNDTFLEMRSKAVLSSESGNRSPLPWTPCLRILFGFPQGTHTYSPQGQEFIRSRGMPPKLVHMVT